MKKIETINFVSPFLVLGTKEKRNKKKEEKKEMREKSPLLLGRYERLQPAFLSLHRPV